MTQPGAPDREPHARATPSASGPPDELFPLDAPRGLHAIWWVWAVYAALFACSIPWYVPAGAPPRLWLGLPHWVAISLASIACVGLFTAFVVTRVWVIDDTDHAPGADAAGDEAPR